MASIFEYIEIKNFKKFSTSQRIEFAHPTVLIGPNNSGKTSVVQALALWSLAIKTWYELRRTSKAKERTSAPINRLAITGVPVPRTRLFWHDAKVRTGNKDINMEITVGVWLKGQCRPLGISFRNQGDELIYCDPIGDVKTDDELIAYASSIDVALLYPMSGIEPEEPMLQPGRIDVLLGQGRTAEVLRNLCWSVHNGDAKNWIKIQNLMKRLFSIILGIPEATSRGGIQLTYKQEGAKEPFDISLAGRGMLQMLLLLAYIYSHPRGVMLIDEPDAHLEILRQRQVFVLLRNIAQDALGQVVLVTHSEVVLEEALDENLTLIIDGISDNLASKNDIKHSLKHYGAANYIKAKERGYVLYLEGSTDYDMLRAFAEKINHPVLDVWDDRVNLYYVQNNYPDATEDTELERVEGGYGLKPVDHFGRLSSILPKLHGLAVLDNDGKNRTNLDAGALKIRYWDRYEAENYFITPQLLLDYVTKENSDTPLFGSFSSEANEVMDSLILSEVFNGREDDFAIWKGAEGAASKLIWTTATKNKKMSSFAEEFFRQFSIRVGNPMLLRKSDLHTLVPLYGDILDKEVSEKLDALDDLLKRAGPI
ncbi:ATP-binding protein [Asticcacaulis sp. EMRT-3]|uniref:AAA family ATPase n=1 Tax=Asticcacaulis sp. EMRT-3 TaxID=3040349 RepID=UPI0024AF0197|nr:ATP-binding protein [Asticcacaulis sp. EMRT-3]MDI7774216.1 ATP-binding protein [Asticcacaulis sp. EMRT-3]